MILSFNYLNDPHLPTNMRILTESTCFQSHLLFLYLYFFLCSF